MDASKLNGNRRARVLVVAALATLIATVAAGCSSSDGESEAEAGSPGATEAWTPPEHPEVRVPQAPDERAVLAGLRLIDPCALMQPAASKVPPFGSGYRMEQSNPHRCAVSNRRADVYVTVGTAFGSIERFISRPLTIAGAKAYVREYGADGCFITIPVSFTRGVEVWAWPYQGRSCEIGEGFAEAVVRGLKDPASVRSESLSTRWDACTTLRRAAGDDFANHYLEPEYGLAEYGLDECGLTRYPPRLATTPGSLDTEPSVNLRLEYSPTPSSWGPPRVEIAGRSASISRGRPCGLEWSQGDAGLPSSDHLLVVLEGPSCERSQQIARAVMRLMDGSAPSAPASTPRLYFRPKEPDSAAVGACMDLVPTWRCTPYDRVEPPTGEDEVVRAAGLDPNVNCAIALDAVREHFGPGLRPVTTTGMQRMKAADPYTGFSSACGFVDPTHALQVWIEVRDSDHAPLGAASPVVFGTDTLAGLPVTPSEPWIPSSVELDGHGRGFSVFLDGEDPESDQLEGWVTRFRPRGTVKDVPSLAIAQRLRPVLTDIIEAHLR